MIRSLRPEDRATLLKLMDEFYHSPAVLHAVPQENMARTVDALLNGTPYADGFLIEPDDAPGTAVGYGLTARTWSNEAGGEVVWVEEAYLRPEYRGHGLGQALFAFLEQYYAGHVRRFRLEVTHENTGAIRLYERLGYAFFDYGQMVRELPDVP